MACHSAASNRTGLLHICRLQRVLDDHRGINPFLWLGRTERWSLAYIDYPRQRRLLSVYPLETLESRDPNPYEQCVNRLVPALHGFKFRHFGHDGIILHEREIRKDEGAFAILKSRERKEQFLDELTGIIAGIPFTVITAVIDKRRLRDRYGDNHHPYHLSLKFCLERLFYFLKG